MTAQELEGQYTAVAALFWNKPAEQLTEEERNTVKKGLYLLAYRGNPAHAQMMDHKSAQRMLECFEIAAHGAILPKHWLCPGCGQDQPIEVCVYSIKHYDPRDGAVDYADLEHDAVICTVCHAPLDDYIPNEQRNALIKAAFNSK